jgi:hypothetical protein
MDNAELLRIYDEKDWDILFKIRDKLNA